MSLRVDPEDLSTSQIMEESDIIIFIHVLRTIFHWILQEL